MVVRKGPEELDVEQLSDGEKCLLALVGDLARRLALANPALAEPLGGNGVVLIDEIELHLHPLWQRQVLKNLTKTFSGCQFFVTTHSPLVLSQLPKESVRIVENFKVVESEAFVEGREANSIMAELMGVPVFPELTAQSIEEIERLTESEKYEEARGRLNQLAQKLGRNDPEVVHQRNAIDFLAEGVFDED
jgi:predicted ATP-binding protein involved in virulence